MDSIQSGKKKAAIALILSLIVFCVLLKSSFSGAWLNDEARISAEISTGKWETPTGCPLRGTLTVTPFMESRQFGIEIKLCLKNVSDSRVDLLETFHTILSSTGQEEYRLLFTGQFDLSEKPYLNPGEEYCFKQRIIFTPLDSNQYHYTVNVTFVDNRYASNREYNLNFSATPTPTTIELREDFSFAFALMPTSTATPAPSHTATAIQPTSLTETATEMPTSMPTEQPSSTPAEPTPTEETGETAGPTEP